MESVKWFLVRFCEGGNKISQSLRSFEMTERGGRSDTFKISTPSGGAGSCSLQIRN